MKYSVVGLGKLGASMAAAIARRGFEVVGVDVNKRSVELLAGGHAPVQETDLESTISANRKRIRATLSHREAVLSSDISFVIVPTPSDGRGAFSLEYASSAFAEIGKALKTKNAYHLVVLTSTVLPGATRYGLIPVLERNSGKTCGQDFGLCYSPEFIALGSIIRDFLNPDFTLVGEFDQRSGDLIQSAYTEIMENHPPCMRMSIENAELAKVSLNAYVTMKITFANMLAEICQKIPGGNVDVVTKAIGQDSRIGAKYLKGALGYGGPCFPRDNRALAFLANSLGVKAETCELVDRTNRELSRRIADDIKKRVKAGSSAAVLGLAYKPLSHVVEESQGISLALALADAGMHVKAFDPLAAEGARAEFGDRVSVCDNIHNCLKDAHLVLITIPDPSFATLTETDFTEGALIVDFWRVLQTTFSNRPRVRYVAYGCSSAPMASQRLSALWR